MNAFIKKNGFIAKPYQDVSMRVRGPILYDMNHNFCHGWAEAEAAREIASSDTAKAAIGLISGPTSFAVIEKKRAGSTLAESRAHLKATDFTLTNGRHSAQLLRTYPAYKEKSIKECYANLTRLTQHFIFIQNQYVQYEDWATHLTHCAEKLRNAGYAKPIYVFIVTSTPEVSGMDHATYSVAKHLGQSKNMVVEHNESLNLAERRKTATPISPVELEKRGIKALMASMWSGSATPRSKNDYEETYIHAKVAIVDDAAFTVGSANLNVRSMALDSELNLLSQAAAVAFDLRTRLFKQCTGDPGPEQFADMTKTFESWLQIMEKNSAKMSSRENRDPLSGQIANFFVKREPGLPVI
jgi:phosphatidylserine/phosphatidylglycerophosphate/cardiolipin synthase-like enzyme